MAALISRKTAIYSVCFPSVFNSFFACVIDELEEVTFDNTIELPSGMIPVKVKTSRMIMPPDEMMTYKLTTTSPEKKFYKYIQTLISIKKIETTVSPENQTPLMNTQVAMQ